MMQVSETQWSTQEHEIAKAAFDKAYAREVDTLVRTVNQQASEINNIADLWRLHDFLSARRHTLDGKYDARESALIFVFSELVKEGWLNLAELEGLAPAKLSKIAALTRIM